MHLTGDSHYMILKPGFHVSKMVCDINSKNLSIKFKLLLTYTTWYEPQKYEQKSTAKMMKEIKLYENLPRAYIQCVQCILQEIHITWY